MRRLAEKVHWDVITDFVYVPDKVLYPDKVDYWVSFADQVERGEVFRGDCDDFSLTCAELLIRRGADKSKVLLVTCLTETNVSHLVCIADGWLLDNRQRAAWRWDDVPYKWQKSMRMDELGIWRKMI